MANAINAIHRAGMPVMGHLGMLPQRVVEEGGYKVKGKTDDERVRLVEDARILAEAGAFALVLELVQADTARAVTEGCDIPTLGIGSGAHCDGQILVTHDLIGLFPWFTPRFVQPRLQTAAAIKKAVIEWMKEI